MMLSKGLRRILNDRQLRYCTVGGFLYYGLIIWAVVGGMLLLANQSESVNGPMSTYVYCFAVFVGIVAGSYLSRYLVEKTDYKVNILMLAYAVQTICLWIIGFAATSVTVTIAMLICGMVLGIDWKLKLLYIEERTDEAERKAAETAYFLISCVGGFIGLAVFNRLAVRFSAANVFVIIGFVSLLLFPILRKLSEREAEEKGWSNFDGM